MTTERDPLVELLDAIASHPGVIEAVRDRCTDDNGQRVDLPDVKDAFWMRRAAVALFASAEKANAALAAIEARRHGKPPERIEHSGGLNVRIDPRDLSDEQLAAVVVAKCDKP